MKNPNKSRTRRSRWFIEIAFLVIGILVTIIFIQILAQSGMTPTVAITATTSTDINIGQSVSFTATVTGGTPPHNVTWYPLGGSGTSISILFSDKGSYSVYAVVVDAADQTSPNSNKIQVNVSTQTPMSKRAILLKEKTQGNTLQPHDWNAIANVYHAYEINMAIVEIANQDDFFGEIQLPAIITAFHAQNIEVHVLIKQPCLTFNKALWQLNSARTPVYTSQETLRAWTCPTNPASIAQALQIVDKILAYDIDGFMFDFIRYPETLDACFCNHCKTTFENYLGHNITDAEWVLNGPYEAKRLLWRSQPINNWVQTISASIKAAKPSVAISAAVFPGTSTWDPKIEIGQDSRYWVQQGYLSFIAPMIYIEYLRPPMDISAFRTTVQWARNKLVPDHEIPIVFFIETQVEKTVPVDLFAQTYQVVKEASIEADGFAIFRYAGPEWTDGVDIRPYLKVIIK